MRHRRARGRSFPGARAPGTPRGHRGTARHDLPGVLITAGMTVSSLAFAFCVIASVAYGWHRAVTGAGIAVSVAAMAALVAAARLRGDGQ